MSIFRSRRRKGAVLVFVAICLMVLFGFAALAIDLSYHRTLQLQAQNAADSAAYAGMVSLRESGDRTEAYNVAVEMLNRHTVGGSVPDADIEIGEWDYDSDSFADGSNPNAISVAVKRDNLEASGGPRIAPTPNASRRPAPTSTASIPPALSLVCATPNE